MIPDNSNWLVQNKILVGGLPQNKKAFDQIKDAGISVFINLMRPTESQTEKKKPKFDYRDEKNRKGIEYYNYPITDGKTISDEKMLEIGKKVVKFVEKGKKVYIHCLGGHGRTGVLAGIVLHLLNPDMTYKEVVQELNIKHKTRKYKPNMNTPQQSGQFNQLHRIISGKDDIFFYNETDANYIFSNFYYKPKKNKKAVPLFVYKGVWYTSEAYYQAQKYMGKNASNENKEFAKLIQKADTGSAAFSLGSLKYPAYPMYIDGVNVNTIIKKYKPLVVERPDWYDVNNKIMLRAIYEKFIQNNDLLKYLINTGDKKLVEYSHRDYYWGTYWDKKGKNMLGKYLIKLRECIKPHKKILLK